MPLPSLVPPDILQCTLNRTLCEALHFGCAECDISGACTTCLALFTKNTITGGVGSRGGVRFWLVVVVHPREMGTFSWDPATGMVLGRLLVNRGGAPPWPAGGQQVGGWTRM